MQAGWKVKCMALKVITLCWDLGIRQVDVSVVDVSVVIGVVALQLFVNFGGRKWAAVCVGLQRCIGSHGPAFLCVSRGMSWQRPALLYGSRGMYWQRPTLLYGSRGMYWQRPALLYGSRGMYWQRPALLYGSRGLYQQSGTSTLMGVLGGGGGESADILPL